MTIVTLTKPTGAFASGIICDDYAYAYSNSFTHGRGAGSQFTYTIFNSGAVSGINWSIQVSNDPNESTPGWYTQVSGTLATVTTTGITTGEGYAFTRLGLRLDISGGTAISGFAWVM